jgi:hypothetical protein
MNRKSQIQLWASILLSAGVYGYFFHSVIREDFTILILIIAFLFLFYSRLVIDFGKHIYILLFAGILFRLTAFTAPVALSEDVYRFLWDGTLVLSGDNPFTQLPCFYEVNQWYGQGLSSELYAQLNSPKYYSVYPPVVQYCSALVVFLSEGDISVAIDVFRALFLSFELLSFFVLLRILDKLKVSRSAAFLYFLNPLVIIEISGNLHFEGVVVMFLLLSFWLLLQSRALGAVASLTAAALTKLNPLMFFPSLLWIIGGWKRMLIAKLLFMALFIAAFIPFFSPVFWEHLSNSLDLYFRNFEFNAGLYFLIRSIWASAVGYNPIHWLGPILSVLGFLLILTAIVFRRKKELLKLPETWMWIYTIYLMTATTVHPWYLIPLVALGVLSGYMYPFFWSALVFLSYSHYGPANGLYEYFVYLEYALVLIIMFLEWKWKAGERVRSSASASIPE